MPSSSAASDADAGAEDGSSNLTRFSLTGSDLPRFLRSASAAPGWASTSTSGSGTPVGRKSHGTPLRYCQPV